MEHGPAGAINTLAIRVLFGVISVALCKQSAYNAYNLNVFIMLCFDK